MQWLDLALSPQVGQITMPEEFRLDQAELTRIWTLFTEESDVKFFRQYVTSFVKSWEEQVSPNWELLVTSTMDGRRVEGPSLSGVLNLSQSRFFFGALLLNYPMSLEILLLLAWHGSKYPIFDIQSETSMFFTAFRLKRRQLTRERCCSCCSPKEQFGFTSHRSNESKLRHS